jgi:hypothetical protein
MPAGGVPDGVVAAVPEEVSAVDGAWEFAACTVAAACAWADDVPADVLPASCVQPARKIPATRIADAMIMMIVLFFMRFVSPYLFW